MSKCPCRFDYLANNYRLESIEGDWHEFESKALRKERDKEARRAEYQKEREKRKATAPGPESEREAKRTKQDGSGGDERVQVE